MLKTHTITRLTALCVVANGLAWADCSAASSHSAVAPLAAGDPCGLLIPGPGQTVTWTADDSPHVICQDILIPHGGRVEIEAGATVQIPSGSRLRVEGEIAANGADDARVRFVGSDFVNDGLDVAVAGQADIRFAEISVPVRVGGENAAGEFHDTVFLAGSILHGVADIVVVERCYFSGGTLGGFSGIIGSVRLSDTAVLSDDFTRVAGLVRIEGVTVDGTSLNVVSETNAYPILIEDVAVVNNTDGPGLTLEGPNFLIGDDVLIDNNFNPVRLAGLGAGLMWGSSLPASGNADNTVLVDEFLMGPRRQWAHTGLPYVIESGFPRNYNGGLRVQPGAEIRFGPNAGAFLIQNVDLELQGTREAPITIKSQFDGGGRWFGLKWVDDFDARARHTVFDGGQLTVQSDGGYLDLVNCTVQNSLEGTVSVTGGITRIFNSKIINNQIGMTTTQSGRIEADGTNSPNIFEGNGVAIDYNNTNTVPFLRRNWWGDPSGPSTPVYPGGAGDPVEGVNPPSFLPFETERPSQADEPPVIDMMPTYFITNAGDKIILRWSSSDDVEVVQHRVEFADHDFPREYFTVATLPGDATTYEFTAPIVEPNNLYPTPSGIRVVAVDSAGQETWDKSLIRIPYHEDFEPTFVDIDSPGAVHPNDRVDICWTPGAMAQVSVQMDGLRMGKSGGGSNTGCLPIGQSIPYASTDAARMLAVVTYGAGGRTMYSFSEYFEIRPDARFGDTPPQIETTSPAAGERFTGGGVIPVRWTASDDEALRSFAIQASYNGGKSWHLVARDLPADTRLFDWRLPESSGIADVRVRVHTLDHRFQESTSTVGPIEILAGGSSCPADWNGDGLVNAADVGAFLSAYFEDLANGTINADFDGNGVTNAGDVGAFLSEYFVSLGACE